MIVAICFVILLVIGMPIGFAIGLAKCGKNKRNQIERQQGKNAQTDFGRQLRLCFGRWLGR